MLDRVKSWVSSLDRWSQRHRSTRIARRAAQGFVVHEALQYAGSMAYFAVLSIFQVLLLGIVVFSFFVGQGTARQFVIDQVSAGSPIDPRLITSVLDSVIAHRGGISLIGFVVLVWSALGAFSSLDTGVSRAFADTKPRPFLQGKLIGLFLMVITGVLVVASVAIGVVTGILQAAAGDIVRSVPGGALALSGIGLILPLVLIFIAFVVIYRVVPNRPVATAEVWPGALVAALLWTVLRVGFTFYATQVARYDSAFGPISTAISLLVFLYFASVILLLGAEVARANVLEDEEVRLRALPPPAGAALLPGPRPAVAPQRRIPGWLLLVGGVLAGLVAGRRSRPPR